MCLNVILGKKLKKPLKVYKGLNTPSLESPYFEKRYILGKHNFEDIAHICKWADINFDSSDPDFVYVDINTGLHSWTSLRAAFRDLCLVGHVFEAEIPKGAYIFRGINNDIVSSEIIVKPYVYKPIKCLGFTFYRKVKYSEKIKPFNY